MERCAPYLDEAQERRLRADFAGIKSKSDFEAVQARLKAFAKNQCEVAEP
jgi:hypothetical protein